MTDDAWRLANARGQQLTVIRQQRDKLLAALAAFIAAYDEMRSEFPRDWDGDPVDEACEAAKLVVEQVSNIPQQ